MGTIYTDDGQYEKFQLCLGKEPEEGISFSEVRTEYGDGYRDQELRGADTGLRRWVIKYPNLRTVGTSENVVVNGVSQTPSQYLWDLFTRQKVTGRPFAITSHRNDQVYLAEFVQREYTESRVFRHLATSGVEFRQVRLPGVTYFDIDKLTNIYGWYNADSDTYSGVGDGSALVALYDDFAANSASPRNFTPSGGPTFEQGEQNSKPVFRFDGVNDYAYRASTAPHIPEIFAAVKVDGGGDGFFDTGGDFFGGSHDSILSANNSTNLWDDQSFAHWTSESDYLKFSYSKNGIFYPEDAARGPIDAFGIIHVRIEEVGSLVSKITNPQFCRTQTSGEYLKCDIGEIILASANLSTDVGREIIEYLTVKWQPV